MRRNAPHPDSFRILPVHQRLGERQTYAPHSPYEFPLVGTKFRPFHPMEPMGQPGGHFPSRPMLGRHPHQQRIPVEHRLDPQDTYRGFPPVQYRLGPLPGHVHEGYHPPDPGFVSFSDRPPPHQGKPGYSRRENQENLQACLHGMELCTGRNDPPREVEDSVENLFAGERILPPNEPSLVYVGDEEEVLSPRASYSDRIMEVKDIIGSLSAHEEEGAGGTTNAIHSPLPEAPFVDSSKEEPIRYASDRKGSRPRSYHRPKRYFDIINSDTDDAEKVHTRHILPPGSNEEVSAAHHRIDGALHPAAHTTAENLEYRTNSSATQDRYVGSERNWQGEGGSSFVGGGPSQIPSGTVVDGGPPSLMQAIPMDIDSLSESMSENESIMLHRSTSHGSHTLEQHQLHQHRQHHDYQGLHSHQEHQLHQHHLHQDPHLRQLHHQRKELSPLGREGGRIKPDGDAYSVGHHVGRHGEGDFDSSRSRLDLRSLSPHRSHTSPPPQEEVASPFPTASPHRDPTHPRGSSRHATQVDNLIKASKMSSVAKFSADSTSSDVHHTLSDSKGNERSIADGPANDEDLTSYLPFVEFSRVERLAPTNIPLVGLKNLRCWACREVKVCIETELSDAHALEVDYRTYVALSHWLSTASLKEFLSASELERKRDFFRNLAREDVRFLLRNIAENIAIEEANSLLKQQTALQLNTETKDFCKPLEPNWLSKKIGFLSQRQGSTAAKKLILKANRMKKIYNMVLKKGESVVEACAILAAAEKKMKETCEHQQSEWGRLANKEKGSLTGTDVASRVNQARTDTPTDLEEGEIVGSDDDCGEVFTGVSTSCLEEKDAVVEGNTGDATKREGGTPDMEVDSGRKEVDSQRKEVDICRREVDTHRKDVEMEADTHLTSQNSSTSSISNVPSQSIVCTVALEPTISVPHVESSHTLSTPAHNIGNPTTSTVRSEPVIELPAASKYYEINDVGFASPKRLDAGSLPEHLLAPLREWGKRELDNAFKVTTFNQAHVKEIEARTIFLVSDWMTAMKESGKEDVITARTIDKEKKKHRKQNRMDVRTSMNIVVENTAIEELQELQELMQSGTLDTPSLLCKCTNYSRPLSVQHFRERFGYVWIRAGQGEQLAQRVMKKVGEIQELIRDIMHKKKKLKNQSPLQSSSSFVDDKRKIAISTSGVSKGLIKPCVLSTAPVAVGSQPLSKVDSQICTKSALEDVPIRSQFSSEHTRLSPSPQSRTSRTPTSAGHSRRVTQSSKSRKDSWGRRSPPSPRRRRRRRSSSPCRSRSRHPSRRDCHSTEDSSVSPVRKSRRRTPSLRRRKRDSRSHYQKSPPRDRSSSPLDTSQSTTTEQQSEMSDWELKEMRHKLILSIQEKQRRGACGETPRKPPEVLPEKESTSRETIPSRQDIQTKEVMGGLETGSMFVCLGKSMIETPTTPTEPLPSQSGPLTASAGSIQPRVTNSVPISATGYSYEEVSDEESTHEKTIAALGGQKSTSRRNTVGYTDDRPGVESEPIAQDQFNESYTTDEDGCQLVIDCKGGGGSTQHTTLMNSEAEAGRSKSHQQNKPQGRQSTDPVLQLEKGRVGDVVSMLVDSVEKTVNLEQNQPVDVEVNLSDTGVTFASDMDIVSEDSAAEGSLESKLEADPQHELSRGKMEIEPSTNPTSQVLTNTAINKQTLSKMPPSDSSPALCVSERRSGGNLQPVVGSSIVEVATVTVLTHSGVTGPRPALGPPRLSPPREGGVTCTTPTSHTSQPPSTSFTKSSFSTTKISMFGTIYAETAAKDSQSSTQISTALSKESNLKAMVPSGLETVGERVCLSKSPLLSDSRKSSRCSSPVDSTASVKFTMGQKESWKSRGNFIISVDKDEESESSDEESSKLSPKPVSTIVQTLPTLSIKQKSSGALQEGGRSPENVSSVSRSLSSKVSLTDGSGKVTTPLKSILKSTGNTTKPTGSATRSISSGSAPKLAESSFRSPESNHKSTGNTTPCMPKSTGNVPKSTGSTLKNTGSVSKPTESNIKTAGTTSKLSKSTGNSSKLTGNSSRITGSSSRITGSSSKVVGNSSKLSAKSSGSTPVSSHSVTIETTQDVFSGILESQGSSKPRSRKRSTGGGGVADGHPVKRKHSSSSSTSGAASVPSVLKSPARTSTKMRVVDHSIADVKKRLLRAKVTKSLHIIEQRNKTIVKQKGDIEQDHQRVKLLTQQLTLETNDATELEKRMESLKKQLSQTEKELSGKQDRIKRLQKEVKNSMSLIQERMKKVDEEKKLLGREKGDLRRYREHLMTVSTISPSSSSSSSSVVVTGRKSAAKFVILDTSESEEHEVGTVPSARRLVSRKLASEEDNSSQSDVPVSSTSHANELTKRTVRDQSTVEMLQPRGVNSGLPTKGMNSSYSSNSKQKEEGGNRKQEEVNMNQEVSTEQEEVNRTQEVNTVQEEVSKTQEVNMEEEVNMKQEVDLGQENLNEEQEVKRQSVNKKQEENGEQMVASGCMEMNSRPDSVLLSIASPNTIKKNQPLLELRKLPLNFDQTSGGDSEMSELPVDMPEQENVVASVTDMEVIGDGEEKKDHRDRENDEATTLGEMELTTLPPSTTSDLSNGVLVDTDDLVDVRSHTTVVADTRYGTRPDVHSADEMETTAVAEGNDMVTRPASSSTESQLPSVPACATTGNELSEQGNEDTRGVHGTVEAPSDVLPEDSEKETRPENIQPVSMALRDRVPPPLLQIRPHPQALSDTPSMDPTSQPTPAPPHRSTASSILGKEDNGAAKTRTVLPLRQVEAKKLDHTLLLPDTRCVLQSKNWILELCERWSARRALESDWCKVKPGLLELTRKGGSSGPCVLFDQFPLSGDGDTEEHTTVTEGGGKIASSQRGKQRGYRPYSSPLTCLKSYRLSPLFWQPTPHLSTSQTFVNKIDPLGTLCRYDLLGSCRDPECKKQHLSQATKVSEKEVIEEIASYDLWAIGIKEQELKAKYGPNVDGKIKHLLSKQVSEYLGKHKFERFLNFLLKKMNSSTVMGEKGPLITHAKASSDRVLPLSSLHNGQPQSNKTLLFLGEDEERNKIDIEGLLSWPLGAPTARETDKTSVHEGRYFAPSTAALIGSFEEYLERNPGDVEVWIKMADNVRGTYSDKMAAQKAAAKVLEKALKLSSSSQLMCKYITVLKELADCEAADKNAVEKHVLDLLFSCEKSNSRAPSAAVILEYAWTKPTPREKVDTIMRFIPTVVEHKAKGTASSDVVELLLVAMQIDIICNHGNAAYTRLKVFVSSQLQWLIPEHCVFIWLCYICLSCVGRLPSHLFESAGNLDGSRPLRLRSLMPFTLSPGEWIRKASQNTSSTLTRHTSTQATYALHTSTQDTCITEEQHRHAHWCNLLASAIKSCTDVMGKIPKKTLQLHLLPLWLSLASVNESFGCGSVCVEWRRAMLERARGCWVFMKWYSLELAHMDPQITTQVLQDALTYFPGDPLLCFVAAKHEILSGRAANCLQQVSSFVETFLESSSDRGLGESPRTVVMMLRKLLGQYVPESCSSMLRPVRVGAVDKDSIVYIWLCYCLYCQAVSHPVDDVLVERYTDTVDVFEAALHSSSHLGDLKLIWKEYLKYMRNRACRFNSTLQHFKEFTDCVHRSLLAVEFREVVTRDNCDVPIQYSNYDFHNEVVDMFVATLPPSDRPIVYKQWGKLLPDNERLLLRAAQEVIQLEGADYQWLQEWVASYLQDHKMSMVVWRIAIALEYRLNHFLEVRWLYKEAVKHVPHCGQIWREYFEFEVEQLRRCSELPAANSILEELRGIACSAKAHGVFLHCSQLQKMTSSSSGPAVPASAPATATECQP